MIKLWQISKYTGILILFFLLNLFNSCKTDEFKFSELKVKEDFSTDMTGPVFAGNLEFRDFLNWEEYSGVNDSKAVLKFSNGTTVDIPTRIIFEPTILVENFPLSIQGSYEFVSINMEFRVNNGTPFPLNLKLRYFDKKTPSNLGPPIQPPAFDEGKAEELNITPVETIHSVLLNEEQRQSFMMGNRIQFTTWFDRSVFLDYSDTLDANYPVDISVVLLGTVKIKNEDQ